MRLIFLFACVSLINVAFAGEYDSLLTKVPRDANVVMLINPDSVFSSQLAQQEKWRDDFEQAYAAGMGHIPPNVKRLVLAAQLDIVLQEPTWQVAAAELNAPLSLPGFARDKKGTLDSIGNKSAVALANDSYVVAFAPTLLAVMSPANRQAIARWTREADAKKSAELSPFLLKAIEQADRDVLTQAIDLQDAIPAEVIQKWLAQAKSLGNVNPKVIAPVLESIQGVTVQIRLTNEIVCRVVVSFDKDATPLVPIAQPVLNEILQTNGLGLPDVANWKTEQVAGGIAFQGTLSKTSLRRLTSLIDQPLAELSAPRELSAEAVAAHTAAQQEKIQGEATLKYYKAIKTQLQDLKEDVDDAVTMGHIAQWMDYGAKQIDRTPQLDVDPAMLDYGMAVAQQLRAAAGALRGIGINTGYRAASINSNTDYYATDPAYRREQKRSIQGQERAVGAAGARQIISEIKDDTAKIRREMTAKYRVEFR